MHGHIEVPNPSTAATEERWRPAVSRGTKWKRWPDLEMFPGAPRVRLALDAAPPVMGIRDIMV